MNVSSIDKRNPAYNMVRAKGYECLFISNLKFDKI